MLTTTMRSDKRKNPDDVEYRLMTDDECRAIRPGSRVWALDDNDELATVRVTSVKKWKTRPGVTRIRYQFGLYQHYEVTLGPDRNNTDFVTLLPDKLVVNGQTRAEFIVFLEGTLIPYLQKAGFTETARDFETAITFMLEDK